MSEIPMAKPTSKVIISCALTGAVHTPTMSPALPVHPDALAEQGIAAAKAGAAILHVHARDPRDGRPTPDLSAYLAFLPRLKDGANAVINVTTGGGMSMTVEDRLRAPAELRPEMCSLNMGSMNFALFQLVNRYQTWKYDWEEPYLRSTEDHVFKNTFRDIARIISVLSEHGCRFEHECYDVGHLYNLAHVVDRKLVKPPFFVQRTRCAGQQRRNRWPHRTGRIDLAGRVAPDDRRQPHWPVLLCALRRAAAAREQTRCDREHVLGRRTARISIPHAICGVEVGRRRLHGKPGG
jgi:uncharacterized protein (DUF849 family)